MRESNSYVRLIQRLTFFFVFMKLRAENGMSIRAFKIIAENNTTENNTTENRLEAAATRQLNGLYISGVRAVTIR